MSTLLRLKKDDERFKLKAGDILECKPYWLDPSDKWTVIRRISDGFDPECNVYRDQVERLPASMTEHKGEVK